MVGAKGCVWFVLALGLAVAVHGAGAPASAPAPAVDCTSALLNLAPCLDFVQDGSNDTKPSKDCCSGLKALVKDKQQVSCLCDAYKQGASFGIMINMTRALALPSSCRVSTPPAISKCGNITLGAPVASPAPSPTAGGPAVGVSPSAGGPASAAAGGVGVPSTTPGASASAETWTPSTAHFLSVAFALCFYHWF